MFYSEQGGLLFYITLKEELPKDNTSELYVADFEGVRDVNLTKLDDFTLVGFTPRKLLFVSLILILTRK